MRLKTRRRSVSTTASCERTGPKSSCAREGEVLLDDTGDVTGIEGFAVDVTDLRHAELEIHSLANYDRLTGLPNRLSFLDLVTHALERTERKPTETAVALLDIDRFKEINESLGHDLETRSCKRSRIG